VKGRVRKILLVESPTSIVATCADEVVFLSREEVVWFVWVEMGFGCLGLDMKFFSYAGGGTVLLLWFNGARRERVCSRLRLSLRKIQGFLHTLTIKPSCSGRNDKLFGIDKFLWANRNDKLSG
jgi:hypothetical protein